MNESKLPPHKPRWCRENVVDLALKILIDFLLWWVAAWLVISSLNTLFPVLAIPHSFRTYGALWIVVMFVKVMSRL